MKTPATPMSVLDAINARRSVRAYTPETLDRATVDALLAAAVRAPTAMREEPWLFAVIQNTGTLKRLSDRAKELLREDAERGDFDRERARDLLARPDFNVFYDASTLIVIYGRPLGRFVVADCWLAAENLMLAACAMGLGTCVIGLAVSVLNTGDVKVELGIPPEVTAFAPIIVGVPSGATPVTPRQAPRIISWKVTPTAR